MKLNKKTKLVFILVALFLIGLSVPSYSWTRKNVKEIETFYNSKLSPIIMIPGSSATENRFDGLVRKLNQDRRGTKHSLLKVKVWNNGRITFEGKIRKMTMNLLLLSDLKIIRMAIAILRNKPR